MARSIYLLLSLSLVHVAGIFLFCRGFLLSRRALDRVSLCPDGRCTLNATHNRAVVLIIDALRFDFVSPHPPEPHSPFHHNVLTLPRELSQSQPDRSFLYHSFVDPPTTTLQRIKGITTGSLSTFVDMGSNFGGSEITEDSLIVQLARARRRMVFMGDDTWLTVYPTAFERKFPFDSFNVEDLHTVDNGVIANIFPLLEPGAPHWDVAIGHFLGVDHVGHRVGPDNTAMRDKLAQMDDVLRRFVNALDDNTLLVVMGDHGMDEKGDHGGDGARETSAALWIYSKSLPLSSSPPPEYLAQTTPFVGAQYEHRLVQQIDLVPSLALLLGLPIPFNNLGTVIPELFGDRLEDALKLNAQQIWEYLKEYRASASGDELDASWETLSAAWRSARSSADRARFTRLALEACRAMWAQFTMGLMFAGLSIIVLSTILGIALFLRSACVDDHELITAAASSVLSALFVFASTWAVFDSKDVVPGHVALFFGSCVFCFVLLVSTVRFGQLSFSLSWSALPVGLHTVSLLSNSFILWEDRMSLFFLLSTTAPSILVAFLSPNARLRNRILGLSLVLAACGRLMSVSTVCREEQAPYCTPTYYATGGSQAPPLLALVLSPLAALVLPELVRRVLAISASDGGPMRFVLAHVVRGALLVGSACWVLEYLESSAQDAPSWIRLARTILVRLSLLVTLVGGMAFWWYGPLCIEVRRDGTRVEVLGFANAVGAPYLLFFLLAGVVPLWTSTQISGQVVLLLAFAALFAWIEIVDSSRDVRAMRTPEAAQAALAALSGKQPPATPVPEPDTEVRFGEVAAVALLAQLAFFGTGHQATLQSIQWKTAFVLSRSVVYPWSPLMVSISTFGPLVVLGGMGTALIGAWCAGPRGLAKTERNATRAALGVMLYFSCLLLGAAVSAAALRRHLMVWKVFAPRLMLACAALLAVDVGVLLGVGVGLDRALNKVRTVFRNVPGVADS
ncbi:alkaline phosphatase-like protein [Exidia glandulosa HHB12029]|uniref:Alkaline phosphatase-like protein n=1 Tax=Exidia glandulosa HHB12029 TaxID=1314781 RepID=A0A165EMF5_EXIGL|nr:alkaline phosphatase-like protein [Exidia glandulosa HHB12029]